MSLTADTAHRRATRLLLGSATTRGWRKTCKTAQVTAVKMNATTTLNTYSHLWPRAEDRTRKTAQTLFETAVRGLRPGVLADNLRTNESV